MMNPTTDTTPRIARGFTLAELLISLAILGLIATFTIPKVLSAQQNTQNKTAAKQAATAFAVATQKTLLKEGRGKDTELFHIINHLNYVKRDMTTEIDLWQGAGTINCSTQYCYQMHDGAILWFGNSAFGGTATTNAMAFNVDPDGKVTSGGSASGPGKSVTFYIYYNGKLRTRGTMEPATCDLFQCWPTPAPSTDPPWFDWK